MDTADALQSLGLTLPSPAYLFGAIAFGLIGIGAWRYGKRRERPITRWIGVGLMLYPYAITATWALYAIGIALCAALFIEQR